MLLLFLVLDKLVMIPPVSLAEAQGRWVLFMMIVLISMVGVRPSGFGGRRLQALDGNNTCLEVSDLPGCSIQECEDAVCSSTESVADLSTCCDDAWTLTCIAAAVQFYTDACQVPPTNNNCYQTDPIGRPGCTDEVCLSLVCEDMPRCCSESYSQSCVEFAIQNCNHPGVADADNNCFEPAVGTAENPAGCHDEKCLDAVCLVDNDCCAGNYTASCTDVARELGSMSCVPIIANNTCYETSPVGGCSQQECERVVCVYKPSCCNDGEVTGQYNSACVAIAEDICL